MLLSDRSDPLPLRLSICEAEPYGNASGAFLQNATRLGFMRVSQNVKTFLSNALSAEGYIVQISLIQADKRYYCWF